MYIYIYTYRGAMQFFDVLHYQVQHLQPEMKELMQQWFPGWSFCRGLFLCPRQKLPSTLCRWL